MSRLNGFILHRKGHPAGAKRPQLFSTILNTSLDQRTTTMRFTRSVSPVSSR
jgi:hypothetical protein